MDIRVLCFTLLISLCAVGIKADSEFKLDDGVIVLSKSDFQKAVDSIQYLLVEFCKYTFIL